MVMGWPGVLTENSQMELIIPLGKPPQTSDITVLNWNPPHPGRMTPNARSDIGMGPVIECMVTQHCTTSQSSSRYRIRSLVSQIGLDRHAGTG